MIEFFQNIDHHLFYAINQSISNPVLDGLCVVARNKKFLVLFYCLLAAWLYQFERVHFFKIVLAAGFTFLLTDQLSSHLLKPLFHRLRPCNNPEIEVRLLADYCGSGFSFVSAHAANSFGMAVFISAAFNWKKPHSFFLLSWAALVSFSQVYVGVHFPADVLAGAVLGAMLGIITGTILKTKFILP